MPRFFFHTHHGAPTRDREGTELLDLHTAQVQAVRLSGEVLRDLGGRFWDAQPWSLEVANARGEVLFALHISAEARMPLPG